MMMMMMMMMNQYARCNSEGGYLEKYTDQHKIMMEHGE